MNRIDWQGYAEKGDLTLIDPDGFRESLKFFSGPVRVTIRKPKKDRSNQQNAYYWGVAVDLLRDRLAEAGYDYSPEEVHEAMKWKFLKRVEEGIELPTVRSTTELSTIEFMEYIANIQRWAAEYLGLVIPDPQEYL